MSVYPRFRVSSESWLCITPAAAAQSERSFGRPPAGAGFSPPPEREGEDDEDAEEPLPAPGTREANTTSCWHIEVPSAFANSKTIVPLAVEPSDSRPRRTPGSGATPTRSLSRPFVAEG